MAPAAAEQVPAEIRDAYVTIQPLIERFCSDCHNADFAEGELDLASLAAWEQAEHASSQWERTAAMIDDALMPPADAEQPSADERAAMAGWLRSYLSFKSKENAGDPGPVALRRLCNAEYAYTIRDLTGVESLDPGREFPVDGAAGEGFTNVGNALAMSPALATKYLDAAKEVAAHAVLLPGGIDFSAHTTRRDWTAERLAAIKALYAKYAAAGGGEELNLQGVVFNSNEGGRLPVEKYLAVLQAYRHDLASGDLDEAEVAKRTELSPAYLRALRAALERDQPSLLLDDLRAAWRRARENDAATLAAQVSRINEWQRVLWKFNPVGHIGKVGGPASWLEAISPLAARCEIRRPLEIPEGANEVVFCLVSSSLGADATANVAIWERPRLVIPGRADLPLREVRSAVAHMAQRRQRITESATACLAAAAEAQAASGDVRLEELAARHAVDAGDLQAWLDYLGIGLTQPAAISGHLHARLRDVAGHAFVTGWKGNEFPQVLANSSEQEVHIPGLLPPRNVVVHPGPTQRATLVWQAPVAGRMSVAATIAHAHSACGNGVAWRLDHVRGRVSQRLDAGIAQGPGAHQTNLPEPIDTQVGDQLVLSIGARDGDHSCDLTNVNLTVVDEANLSQRWDLSEDVSGDLLAANPHADHLGHPEVWHFIAEGDRESADASPIPAGSLADRWRSAASSVERAAIAQELTILLASTAPPSGDDPDAMLFRDLAAWRGPLLGSAAPLEAETADSPAYDASPAQNIGIDPSAFGKAPDGSAIDADGLAAGSSSVIEVRLPADLAASCEFAVAAALHPTLGKEGAAQFEVVMGAADSDAVRLRVEALQRPVPGLPIVTVEGSETHQRLEREVHEFRQLFPAALCYATIVPVDEVVTLTLFHREDEHFSRLMLSDPERAELNQLWQELHFISEDAQAKVDALEQLIEYATQDGDPSAFTPLREPFAQQAAEHRQAVIDAEPHQLDSVLAFASRAYRRALSDSETTEARRLYATLREEGLDHEAAIRLMIARVLASPAFLYRLEQAPAGEGSGPISNEELATRLSYFLWSSAPDEPLRKLAADGALSHPDVLRQQTQRLLRDGRINRLAREFACQWLHIRGFETHDEKSEAHFPEFAPLRAAMAHESELFFTDLFEHDRSILSIIDGDHAFLNESLAAHYGVPNVSGPEWRRVDGVRQFGRGGILGQATTLAANSGASRTSPILRGVWISEVLLGERLPKPPAGVPPLPDDQSADDTQTVRQLVERHVSDPKCAVCHRRIDPYGFALEEYDAIGRRRTAEPNGQPIDAASTLTDGTKLNGLDGLRDYVLTTRRDDFVRQFCRKLLGYALGRAVILSDEPLLTEMETQLAANDYRVSVAVEAIVLSRQFREIRGSNASATASAFR